MRTTVLDLNETETNYADSLILIKKKLSLIRVTSFTFKHLNLLRKPCNWFDNLLVRATIVLEPLHRKFFVVYSKFLISRYFI